MRKLGLVSQIYFVFLTLLLLTLFAFLFTSSIRDAKYQTLDVKEKILQQLSLEKFRYISGETNYIPRPPKWMKIDLIGLDPKATNNYQIQIEKTLSAYLKNNQNSKFSQGIIEAELLDAQTIIGFIALPNSTILTISAPKSLIYKKISYNFLIHLLVLILSMYAIYYSSQLLLKRYEDDISAIIDFTLELSKGNFDHQFQSTISSSDTNKIKRSLEKLAEDLKLFVADRSKKLESDSEIRMAQQMQESFISSRSFDNQRVSCRGFFRPASTCSGDWFFHTEINGKYVFCIGDATGHGLSSALLTAVSNSALLIYSETRDISPSEIMEGLNKVVYKTTKGELQMTLFLGIIDFESSTLRYANASHEAPIVIKKGIPEYLECNPQRRLGESETSQFHDEICSFRSGDSIFTFTDGIFELQSEGGKPYNDRRLLNLIKELKKIDQNRTDEFTIHLMENIKAKNTLLNLHDDVTWLYISRV